jgi:hypothetical protein
MVVEERNALILTLLGIPFLALFREDKKFLTVHFLYCFRMRIL